MQCIKCAKQLTRTKKGVNCSTCDGMFHVSCGQISEALFKSIENGSSDWRCLSCRNTNNRKSIINMRVMMPQMHPVLLSPAVMKLTILIIQFNKCQTTLNR